MLWQQREVTHEFCAISGRCQPVRFDGVSNCCNRSGTDFRDTTARKQPLTTWGVQFEEFEYRYSDDDEELGVWNADLFYGTDDLKVRWLTKGEYAIEEKAYETLENQLVGQVPISDFFDAKAGIRFDTPRGPDRTYAVLARCRACAPVV